MGLTKRHLGGASSLAKAAAERNHSNNNFNEKYEMSAEEKAWLNEQSGRQTRYNEKNGNTNVFYNSANNPLNLIRKQNEMHGTHNYKLYTKSNVIKDLKYYITPQLQEIMLERENEDLKKLT